jgi:hypothetical protein
MPRLSWQDCGSKRAYMDLQSMRDSSPGYASLWGEKPRENMSAPAAAEVPAPVVSGQPADVL